MISVIIPTYQHAKTLPDCLQTILNQTVAIDEIIVVNDGSTDNTIEVLKPFADRIHLIDQENSGRAAARNRGFEASHGDFIIFCDADEHWRKDMIEKMLCALQENPEVAYAYCAFRFGWKRFSSFPFNASRLKKMNYIHTTALIRRQDFPGFDESIKKFQDWDLWLTILENGKEGIFIPDELFQIENPPGRSIMIASFAQAPSNWYPSFFYKIPWH